VARRASWFCRAWLALSCAAVLLRVETAYACSYPSPPTLDPDATLADDTAPLPVEDVSFAVRRGTAGEREGCSRSSTSCDDIGTVLLFITPASEDTTPIEELGFVIEVVDGEAPTGLIPPGALQLDQEGKLTLPFVDGATDDQEIIAFTILVTVMDAAGNLSEPSEPIRIYDSGKSGGCRTAPGTLLASPWPGALLVLGVFLAFARLLRRVSARPDRES
jgi:hypothetical protein